MHGLHKRKNLEVPVSTAGTLYNLEADTVTRLLQFYKYNTNKIRVLTLWILQLICIIKIDAKVTCHSMFKMLPLVWSHVCATMYIHAYSLQRQARQSLTRISSCSKEYKLMYSAVNTDRSAALFRHPPVTGAYGAVLLSPFEMNVWTSCAGMWLAVILTIRFVSWVETSMTDYMATAQEETVRSWSDCLMIIIGAISEQGVYFF